MTTHRRFKLRESWLTGAHLRADGTIDPAAWTNTEGAIDPAALVACEALQEATTRLVAALGGVDLSDDDRDVIVWLARREQRIVDTIASWPGRARPRVDPDECARRMDMLAGKLHGVVLNEGDWLFLETLANLGMDEVAHLARLFALVYVAGARSAQAGSRPTD